MRCWWSTHMDKDVYDTGVYTKRLCKILEYLHKESLCKILEYYTKKACAVRAPT
jgi:hypothetical protein